MSQGISHEEAFRIANNFLGWGERDIDGKGSLWFVGLEEAAKWTPEALQRYCNRGEDQSIDEHPEMGASEIFSGVTGYCSKIACSLSGGYGGLEWRRYRKEKLWRVGCGILHINLFPIGRTCRSEYPEDVKTLFGYGQENWREYERVVFASDRFERITKLWRAEPRPQAVICFGKEGWQYTDAIFELKPHDKQGSAYKFWVDEHKRVIQTKFFCNYSPPTAPASLNGRLTT